MKRIKVLYLSHESKEIAGATLSLFNLIHSVENWVEPVVLLDRKDIVYDFFQSKGIDCMVFPFTRVLYNYGKVKRILLYLPRLVRDSISNYRCLQFVRSQLGKQGVDIIHSNSSAITVGEYLAKGLGVKHVWHVREFLDKDFHFHPFGGMDRLRKRINRADASIAITSQVAQHWNLTGKNAYVIWDAVRKEEDVCVVLPKEKYFLFCCASLSDTKGPDTAVKAFCQSGLSQKGYRLKMVGNCTDDYKKKLECIMQSFSEETKEKVEFLGYQKDITPLMKKATAFLMCSHNEGLGRVTIEAMCYGCPVIARKSGGTVDYLKDRETGFFFTDEEECAILMNEVSSMAVPTTINAANEFFKQHFTEEVYGIEINGIYQELLRL
jgi:glycosyltransferase involved in cell wall biosynthesis